MIMYYGFTTYDETVKDEMRKYLKENNIYYELSSCYDGWHFEIKMLEEQMKNVNDFLMNINGKRFG